MKYIILTILLLVNLLPGLVLFGEEEVETPKPMEKKVAPKKISVQEKKKRFYNLLVPAINEVYDELEKEYQEIANNIKNNINSEKIATLKVKYKVETNKELLMALKPHKRSIAIAQAAMESAWGTSRFFRKANNIFGVWSTNANQKRIAAQEKRGKTTIWVRKYDNLDESIRHYYFLLSSSTRYRKFKKLNYETDDVCIIITGLKDYSERGYDYVKELGSMIKYNKLKMYDN